MTYPKDMLYPFSTYDISKTYYTHIGNMHHICYTPLKYNVSVSYFFLTYDTHMTCVLKYVLFTAVKLTYAILGPLLLYKYLPCLGFPSRTPPTHDWTHLCLS
jgi:hypothetical protein